MPREPRMLSAQRGEARGPEYWLAVKVGRTRTPSHAAQGRIVLPRCSHDGGSSASRAADLDALGLSIAAACRSSSASMKRSTRMSCDMPLDQERLAACGKMPPGAGRTWMVRTSSRATGARSCAPLSVSLTTNVTLAAPQWPAPVENGSAENPFWTTWSANTRPVHGRPAGHRPDPGVVRNRGHLV